MNYAQVWLARQKHKRVERVKTEEGDRIVEEFLRRYVMATAAAAAASAARQWQVPHPIDLHYSDTHRPDSYVDSFIVQLFSSFFSYFVYLILLSSFKIKTTNEYDTIVDAID